MVMMIELIMKINHNPADLHDFVLRFFARTRTNSVLGRGEIDVIDMDMRTLCDQRPTGNYFGTPRNSNKVKQGQMPSSSFSKAFPATREVDRKTRSYRKIIQEDAT